MLAWISSWAQRSRIPFPYQMYDSNKSTARRAAIQFLRWTHNTMWKHLLACTNASSAAFWGCPDLLHADRVQQAPASTLSATVCTASFEKLPLHLLLISTLRFFPFNQSNKTSDSKFISPQRERLASRILPFRNSKWSNSTPLKNQQ